MAAMRGLEGVFGGTGQGAAWGAGGPWYVRCQIHYGAPYVPDGRPMLRLAVARSPEDGPMFRRHRGTNYGPHDTLEGAFAECRLLPLEWGAAAPPAVPIDISPPGTVNVLPQDKLWFCVPCVDAVVRRPHAEYLCYLVAERVRVQEGRPDPWDQGSIPAMPGEPR